MMTNKLKLTPNSKIDFSLSTGKISWLQPRHSLSSLLIDNPGLHPVSHIFIQFKMLAPGGTQDPPEAPNPTASN